tara:strand:- start:2636 stop:3322 length:687 start_codon:yes stop_codon:yes gene_type:complete
MNKRKEYEDFLKDKRVCLVGPAPTVKDIEGNLYKNKQEQIDKIESYDVIVRLNIALPMPPSLAEYVGSRTEIIYNCMSPDPESGGYINIDFLKEKISWIVASLPAKHPFTQDIIGFYQRNQNTINFTTVELDYFNELEQKMQTRPNTGVIAILDMLACDIKEIFITGMTFFRGGYVKEYRGYNEQEVLSRMAVHKNHRQEPQLAYMKEILSSDPRVKMDKYLQDIINE